MSDIIVSVKSQTVTTLSNKKELSGALTFKSNVVENSYALTYRANTNHAIAFRINESISTDFQAPYLVIF